MDPIDEGTRIRVPVRVSRSPLHQHGHIMPPFLVVIFTKMYYQTRDEYGHIAHGWSFHCGYCSCFIVDWYPGTLLDELKKHAEGHYE